MSKHSLVLALGERRIAFSPTLARIGGSANAGLFMSQALYWYGKVRRPFYKTQEEWTEETCLGRWEQRTVRRRWRELGVLKEEQKGWPPKLWFDIDVKRLEALIKAECAKPPQRCAKPPQRCAKPPQPTETTSKTTFRDSVLQTGASPNGHAPHAPPSDSNANQDRKFLRELQGWLKAEPRRLYTRSEVRAMRSWKERVDEIWERTPLDNPVNGWARGLGDELHAILEDYEECAA